MAEAMADRATVRRSDWLPGEGTAACRKIDGRAQALGTGGAEGARVTQRKAGFPETRASVYSSRVRAGAL